MNEWGFLEGYFIGVISTCVLVAIVAINARRKEPKPPKKVWVMDDLKPDPDPILRALYEEHRRVQ